MIYYRKLYRFVCPAILNILGFIAICGCNSTSQQQNANMDANTDIFDCDTIQYVPLIQYPAPCLVVAATANSTMEGNFLLDTGSDSGIIIDSTFFFNYVDTTSLVQQKLKYRMFYWRAEYKGDVTIKIGNYEVDCKNIDVIVLNWNRDATKDKLDSLPRIAGLIASNVFIDKISIVDFEKNRIAFVDTVSIDSSYISIPLFCISSNQRYLKIDGFKNNKGEVLCKNVMFDTGQWATALYLATGFGKSLIKSEELTKIKNSLFWHIDTLKAGDFIATNVPTGYTDSDFDGIVLGERYINNEDGVGLLGVLFFWNYDLIIDYKKNYLYVRFNDVLYKKNKIQ